MGAALVFANLLFTRTERLVVIRRTDRKDLPHLTISFKNDSGEIDGHLKDEYAHAGADPYTPLFKFPKAAVEGFLEGFLPDLEKVFLSLYFKLKKVRPGRLGRWGYTLALMETEAFKSQLYESAPKLKGKYRVDSEKLKRLFTNVDPSTITLLRPSELHSDELKNRRDPIYAVRPRGKTRMILVKYAPWKTGNRAWIILNPLAEEIPKLFEGLVPREFKEELRSVWYRVYEALQLHELGVERD